MDEPRCEQAELAGELTCFSQCVVRSDPNQVLRNMWPLINVPTCQVHTFAMLLVHVCHHVHMLNLEVRFVPPNFTLSPMFIVGCGGSSKHLHDECLEYCLLHTGRP